MSQPLQLIRDDGGYATCTPDNALHFSTVGQYFTLAANVITSVTVPNPGDASRLIAYITYTAGANVWVSPSSVVLTLPSGTVTDTSSELNPASRGVKPSGVLQFLTSDSNVAVGIKYYSVQ